MPPAGVGRFIEKLTHLNLAVLPVGAYEEEETLCLHFGKPYRLEVPSTDDRHARDREVALIVMQHIAGCLPPHLRSFDDASP